MKRHEVEVVPLGNYLLVFVQPEKSRRPQLSLPFNMRDKRTVYELADMYLEELQRVQGYREEAQKIMSVVLTKGRMKWSEQMFHGGDNRMKVRQWIKTNLNGESTIYVYIQESHEDAFYIGDRTSLILEGSFQDSQKTRDPLQVALFKPWMQNKVDFLDTRATTVRECLNSDADLRGRLEQFEYSVKERDTNTSIKLQRSLHEISQGSQDRLINTHSVIEIHPRQKSKLRPQSQQSNQNKNIPLLLKFHSKESTFNKKSFKQFSLDYDTHKQFHCVNICRMVGFQFPASFVIRATINENDQYLKGDHALSEWQDKIGRTLGGKNQLDCYFLNEHEYYYQMLERNEGLNRPADLDSILRFTAKASIVITKTNSRVRSLLDMMEDDDEDHKYLPRVVKSQEYFRPITAYTTDEAYQQTNYKLRSSPPAMQDRAALEYGQRIAQKISYLPLCDPSRVYYRGLKIQEWHQKDEIIFYRQIFSSSSNIDKGIQFMGAKKANGTLFIIESLSSRLIDPFSVHYPVNREYEYLNAPYTPFLVTEVDQLQEYYQVKMEELPLIRNYSHNHLVWLGEDLNFIINFYNQLRYIPNKRSINEQYLKIDLLPFKSDKRLELWLGEFQEIDVREDKAISIFTLPEDQEQKLARIKLIQQKIKARAYICYGKTKPIEFNNRCRDLQIAQEFLEKIQYTDLERDLKYCIISQKGFSLQNYPCCHSHCQIM